jgi:integrase
MPTDPHDIDESTIRWLVTHTQYAASSWQVVFNILGTWLKWETGRNPVIDADLLWNRVEPDRLFIDKEALEAALAVSDARDRLILLMGAKMGLRRMEIAGAKLSDISGDRILIWGKGHGEGKPAVVLIHPEVRRALDEWMVIRDEMDPDRLIPEIILTRMYGRPQGAQASSIGKIVHGISERCGRHITPHSLRRLYATTLHEDLGADICDISTLMRHENIETTKIYIRMNRNRLDALASQV